MLENSNFILTSRGELPFFPQRLPLTTFIRINEDIVRSLLNGNGILIYVMVRLSIFDSTLILLVGSLTAIMGGILKRGLFPLDQSPRHSGEGTQQMLMVLAFVSNKTLLDAGTGFLSLIKNQYVWGYFMNNTDQFPRPPGGRVPRQAEFPVRGTREGAREPGEPWFPRVPSSPSGCVSWATKSYIFL